MATEFISNSWLMPTNANAEANRVSNYSLDFDGSSDYVDCGVNSSLVSATNFSLSGWFYFDSVANNKTLYSYGGATNQYSFTVQTHANGNLIFVIASATNDSGTKYIQTNLSSVLTTSTWTHIVCTFDGSQSANTDKAKIYINGTEAAYNTGSGTIPATTSASTGTFNIGRWQGIGRYFDGKITEVSIFDYSLSASQVLELYGTGSAIGNPMAITNGRKPVNYYPLGNSAFNSEFLVPNGAEQDYVFSFVGTNDDQINLSSEISSSSEFTLSYWMNPATFGGIDSYIMGQRTTNDNYIYNSQVGRLAVRINGLTLNFNEYAAPTAGHSGANNMVASTWQHMIIIRDSSNDIRVWRNGVAFGDESGYNNSDTFTLDQIGCFLNGYGWQGMLSNVAWWTSDQSANISNIYNNGTPSDLTSLSPVGWWELDASATFDGSNWSIPDASSNSNTGISSNMTAANLVQSDLIINAPYDSFSLSFDGTNDFINTGSGVGNSFGENYTGAISISIWFKSNVTSSDDGIFQFEGSTSLGEISSAIYANDLEIRIKGGLEVSGSFTDTTNWHHLVISLVSPTGANQVYLDGVPFGSTFTYSSGGLDLNGEDFIIGHYGGSRYFNGSLSNCSIYNSALSAAQVTTLYNEAKPFNLNNFAVTPVSWWRLGSVNSSFDGTNWTVLDEIGTNNGTSANMTQADLVDGVGATGSGTSSGMSSGTNRTGDAPYSENNAVSYNMSVTAKSSSVPT